MQHLVELEGEKISQAVVSKPRVGVKALQAILTGEDVGINLILLIVTMGTWEIALG